MPKSPFFKTLFLDADTYVLCDLNDVFQLLDKFDIALGHAMIREKPIKHKKVNIDVPKSFPQFNSGVFLYKKNEKTLAALEKWKKWFHETQIPRDQFTLREIIWESDLRVATLPPEYNVRYIKYIIMWNKYEAKPKILHMGYLKDGPFVYIKKWPRKIKRYFTKLYRRSINKIRRIIR